MMSFGKPLSILPRDVTKRSAFSGPEGGGRKAFLPDVQKFYIKFLKRIVQE